ncbi:hypothetical protein EDC04DRAFT_2613604 [Pisolithus marmoratus]|nr:hypothetical protein EDC04DRAFT_2613604 [Pisolithus marmoratus]
MGDGHLELVWWLERFFEHEDGWEGMRQDQRNPELEQEWLIPILYTSQGLRTLTILGQETRVQEAAVAIRGIHVRGEHMSRSRQFPSFLTPTRPALHPKNNSMSQPIIPVFSRDYMKVRVPIMWNNKMSAIQELLNAVPSEGDDPMDSYRWLDRYDQLHYKAESIHNYAQGMHIAIPELPEAVEVSMAAADLAITKLQSLHHEHKSWMTAPRIFMVPPSAWAPSNVEGYGNRPKWAQRQTEKAAVGSGKGKQKMTQDNEDEDKEGADDHKDDQQGGGDDNNKALENLDGLCKECSGEGRGVSCEGEPQQCKNPLAPQAAASLSNKHAKLMPPAARSSSDLPPVKSRLFLSSTTPSSVWYPDHALTPANFSPLASVNELQELFEGGFLATVTGLLQDKEMLVVPEEVPKLWEGQLQVPLHGATPSSSPARTTPWLYTLDEQIERLEETIEMNKVEVAEMHEDLARFTVQVSRFGSMVLEQHCQLKEIRELWRQLLIKFHSCTVLVF